MNYYWQVTCTTIHHFKYAGGCCKNCLRKLGKSA